jgi:hypothetical protein
VQALDQALDQAQQQAQEQPYGDAAPGAEAAAAAAEQHQHADQDNVPAVRHEYEHAEAAARAGGGGGGGRGLDLGSFKLPADAILKQDIPLPRRMASCVIGIKGQSVSKLRRESGAKIHVRPAVGREEMDQVVEIEGAIESVSVCWQSWQHGRPPLSRLLLCASAAANCFYARFCFCAAGWRAWRSAPRICVLTCRCCWHACAGGDMCAHGR